MKTQEFLNLLEQNTSKSLLFEYRPNKFVAANYHITEVKHIAIDSVDCGAQSESWNETVIQLWESPAEFYKTKFMSALKALGILKKVGKMKPFDMDSEIKFEYGNSDFHTAQLFVSDIDIDPDRIIVKLSVEKTDCKAKTLCGVEETVKKAVVDDEPCCAPDGNCC